MGTVPSLYYFVIVIFLLSFLLFLVRFDLVLGTKHLNANGSQLEVIINSKYQSEEMKLRCHWIPQVKQSVSTNWRT